MPTNTLTDAKCRAFKPGAKAVKVFDGGGLYLYVTPSGAKVWRLAYRLQKRPQTISIGPYPEISLAEARARRDEHKATLRAGADPMAPRRAQRSGTTLEEACIAYWAGRQDTSDGYRENIRRALEMHVYPRLGSRSISTIGKDELMLVLNPMNTAGLFDYVRKVRIWLGLVFEWAIEHGKATHNPTKDIDPEKAFGRRTVENFAALRPAEVPAFMKRLSLEDQHLQSVLACRLLAVTWVRTKELRMMKWAEIEGDVWRIPKGTMKKRREHLVPLCRQALALLEELSSRGRRVSPYVFVAEHRDDRPMSENAVLALIARIGYKGRMTGHGWRSVASTWANEAGYNADAIERQLAHEPDDKTRAAYNRAEFIAERRQMLQAFADWLDECSREVDAVAA